MLEYDAVEICAALLPRLSSSFCFVFFSVFFGKMKRHCENMTMNMIMAFDGGIEMNEEYDGCTRRVR